MKKVFNFLSAVSLLTVFALFYGCKKEEVPTLTTTAITSITTATASSGGNITDDGNADVTARGVCWGTSTKPDVTGSKTTDGTGVGSFTSSLTALTANTLYYVRAYATNSEGTGYGSEVTFTTNPIVGATVTTATPSAITANSAVAGGDVTADGGATVTEKGICWATTASPTTANNKIAATGTGTGAFTANITGLLPGTAYHVRAYAINSSGTAYGTDVTFTTLAVKPTVTTADVTVFTQTTATAGGDVTATGGADVTEKGVCYATTANPTTAGTHIVATTTGLGAFTVALPGLTAGTLYHVRAYAKNSVDTEYGADKTFTTSAVLAATVTTATPGTVTATTAVFGGEVTSNGGGTISARGVCYGTSPDPALPAALHTTETGGVGTFSSTVSGLSNGTVYYARAYVTNEIGTVYGTEVQLLTMVADVDNNLYKTVVIGTQVWMAENLKTTQYNTSNPVSYVSGNAAWAALSTPAYCWYNDVAANKDIYGALYNWYAASAANLCPSGWHVPTDGDFNTMELSIGVLSGEIDVWGWRGTTEGAEMKNTTGWASNGNGSNTSGFTALPGGYRQYGSGGSYGVGELTYFWTATQSTSTEGWFRHLTSAESRVNKAATSKVAGKYIRCVKN